MTDFVKAPLFYERCFSNYAISKRESAKLEYYYNEFVKRDWYKDKNLFDSSGRRVGFDRHGAKVWGIQRARTH